MRKIPSQAWVPCLLVMISLSTSAAHASNPELKPICERSHAYVVDLLSTKLVYSEPGDGLASLEHPDYVTESEGDHMVASGQYTRVPDPHYPGRFSYASIMQMGTGNIPGRYGTGLCWWHTRFHRAAAYLTEYRPDLSRPDAKKARQLMRQISFFKPTVIPGYSGLAEFTRDFSKQLYSVLSDWETRTTLFAPQHALGEFLTKVFSSNRALNEIYDEQAWNITEDLTVFPRPVFLAVDTGGLFGSHSLLALKVRTDSRDGTIWLREIDSYDPGGSSERSLIQNGHFSPSYKLEGLHAAFGDDFELIRDGLRTRCGASYQIPRR